MAMVNCFLFLLTLTTLAHCGRALRERYQNKVCQEITIPMCKGIGYNQTYMPNKFNHDSQEEAGLEVHQFWPLVEIQCSPDLQFFLCSMYTPICVSNYDEPLPVCRSICERARAGCEPLMQQYGFPWPERMSCDRLPEPGDETLCMDFNTSEAHPTVTPSTAKNLLQKSTHDHHPTKPAKIDPSLPNPRDSEHRNIQPSCTCACYEPLRPVTAESVQYFNRVHAANISNCLMNCESSYFSPEAINFATFWVGAWSTLCCLSTILTVITYIIDMGRFVYPEKSIIFLAACYFMVSIGYIIMLLAGRENVGCDGQFVRPNMTAPATCTIVFLLIYFFGMAACIWWVILSFTWFLAAGLKWSHEAIASYSLYFHLTAWLLPTIKSITVLAVSGVDGDPVAGICYVGNQNTTNLWAFILAPLFLYLILGLSFLSAGLINLFRIREAIRQQGDQKTEKLEKLIIKLGVFSVLYTIPAIIVIACHLYEQHFKEMWDASIACPCGANPVRPDYLVFMLKYFMYHIVGITSGFWIWSGKTLTAWRSFCSRILCRKRPRDKFTAISYTRAASIPTSSTKSSSLSSV